MEVIDKTVRKIPNNTTIINYVLKSVFTDAQIASMKKWGEIDLSFTTPVVSTASYIKRMGTSAVETVVSQSVLIVCSDVVQNSYSYLARFMAQELPLPKSLLDTGNMFSLSPICLFLLTLPIIMNIYYGIVTAIKYRNQQPAYKTVATVISVLVTVGFAVLMGGNYILMNRLKMMIFLIGATNYKKASIILYLCVFYSYVLAETFKLFKDIKQRERDRKFIFDLFYLSVLAVAIIIVSLSIGIEGITSFSIFKRFRVPDMSDL